MEQIMELLGTILQGVILAVVPILAGYVIQFIKRKQAKIEQETENQFIDAMIGLIQDVISRAVAYVTQTYVDNLKKDGKFDIDEQKKAFEMAYDRIAQLINEEQKEFINSLFGNFRDWVSLMIESAVKEQKK